MGVHPWHGWLHHTTLSFGRNPLENPAQGQIGAEGTENWRRGQGKAMTGAESHNLKWYRNGQTISE